jgi:hypothetical protein
VDPVTAFATIVGLLGTFKAERRASSDDDYRDFMEWLGEKRHDDLIKAIHSNQELAAALTTFLESGHEEVMAKLSGLDRSLLELASQIDGVQQLAHAIAPQAELSSQAFSILKQLNDSGGSVFLEMKMLGGTLYQIMDTSAQLEIEEPRFVEDDLEKLCRLGLLLQDYNNKGGRLFRITRASVRYVENAGRHS